MTPARFRWGLLFILTGALLLLAQADVLNLNFLFDFIYLLPFLLIAIGIEKIFAKTRLVALSYLSSILLVGGALYVAFEGSRFSKDTSFFESSSISYEADDKPVDVINAVLKLGDAGLTVRNATDELFKARFDEWSRKPRTRMEIIDGTAEITLTNRTSSRRYWGGAIKIETDEGGDWRVSFSKDIPLILKCIGEDSDVHLNLASSPLRELRLDLDDADIYVKLGNLEPEVQIVIVGNDSKLRLRVPQEAGLKVSGLDDPEYLQEIGLIEQNSIYLTENFGEARSRIQVDLDDNFRSLSIDFY